MPTTRSAPWPRSARAGVASGGNGTAAGNGSLSQPAGIDVDQDSGDVYVSDLNNHRVNVYTGDGVFLRSFGGGVVESGPGQVAGSNEKQQLTVKATGGKFSLFFAGQSTGGMGIGTTQVASNLVTEVETTSGAFAVGQAFSAKATSSSFLPGTNITAIDADTLTISEPATLGFVGNTLFGDDLDFNASAAQVQAALNALPTVGGVGGSVTVTGGPGNLTGSAPYTIEFGGSLAGADVPQLTSHAGNLQISSGTASAAVSTLVEGGAYEVCSAAVGDVCRAGGNGPGVGSIGSGAGIAVSTADGDPGAGAVFVADSGNHRVDSFNLDGSSPSSFGSATFYGGGSGTDQPTQIAVDSRGIVYASNVTASDPVIITGSTITSSRIERYDSQDANGTGVGFLAPILNGVDEEQKVTIAASAGQFKLSLGADTTPSLPFNATASQVEAALGALSSIGGVGNVDVSGGPGNSVGSNPYRVRFVSALGAKDVTQLIASSGGVPLGGGVGASVTTTTLGQAGLVSKSEQSTQGLAVDPDGDVLYVQRAAGAGVTQQFGSLNSPGLIAAPTADDARHGTLGVYSQNREGIAIDESTGRLYVSSESGQAGGGVYVLGNTGPPPTASLDSIGGVTSTSAVLHATIDPNGPPDTSYHFEYSTDGSDWTSTPTTLLGHQDAPQAVDLTLDAAPVGLSPNTLYHARLVFQRRFATADTTAELTFTTDPAAPTAETVGAPLRTTTSAQLGGRLNPRNSAATYHFEYGDQGPCDANPCTATADRSAGSGDIEKLVGEQIGDLTPGTTYHYRLVADNGNASGPAIGGDMTVTTRASEAPLSHGDFPGPPGSDRAYEQVSLSDANGNPAGGSSGVAEDGNRAVYAIAGGTPLAESGAAGSLYSADRTPSGWHSKLVTPPRAEQNSPIWGVLGGPSDLSTFVAENFASDVSGFVPAVWRLSQSGEALRLFEPVAPQDFPLRAPGPYVGVSADASRTVAAIQGGSLDPAYPAAAAIPNLYDISSGGAPQLLSLLPGEALSPCGVEGQTGNFSSASQSSNWISADGSLVYFSSRGNDCGSQPQLYLRDVGAGVTKAISATPVSDPPAARPCSGQSRAPLSSGRSRGSSPMTRRLRAVAAASSTVFPTATSIAMTWPRKPSPASPASPPASMPT